MGQIHLWNVKYFNYKTKNIVKCTIIEQFTVFTILSYLYMPHSKKYFYQTPEINNCCPVKYCLVPQ